MNNLINKNILVTGSNKGIGKELAIGLGSQGANIILLGRNSTGLDEVYDDLQKSRNTSPMIIECDLEKLDEKQGQEINDSILGSYGHLDSDLLNSKFKGPQGVLATTSAIYIADSDNHRIRKIEFSGNSAFSSEPTAAITFAFDSLASWIAAKPTPPAAAFTKTLSPSLI